MQSDLFNGSHSPEQNPTKFSMPNKKLLRVQVRGDELVAAAGSMVAYKGNIDFKHKGSGSLGGFIKKRLSGENAPLMKMTGQGEVFLAREAQEVFMMMLEGDGISISSRALLAFEGNLNYDIKMLRSGGGLMGGGLFNVQVSGRGNVAVTSDGPPLMLDCSSQPVYVDPQAVLCWSSNLQPTIKNDVNFGALFGRGSGETFQMAFSGPGFVVIQPSEGSVSNPGVSNGGGGAEGAASAIGNMFG